MGSRYTGRRGGGGRGPVLVLLVAVLVALAVWLGRGLLGKKAPEPEVIPTPTPVPTATPTPEPTPTPMAARPEAVRGVYVSGPVAGAPYMETILDLVAETELNAVVIDVKNDDGEVTYIPAGGTAKEIGACVRYIGDLPGLVADLKAQGVYTIARVVAFKDPILAKARPELALKGKNGAVIQEGGLPWLDPYKEEVWDYLVEVALGAAEVGFDEVQFDYVRFSTGKGGGDLALAPEEERTRTQVVGDFLAYAREALREKGVWLSADVFGTVITNRTDATFLGQDYALMGGAADVVSPMVYPSHYAAGAFGLEVPDAQPYETVLAAMKASQTALGTLEEGERPTVRPWLQDFTATWVRGHITYGGEELRAQIQAVYDAGYSEWILWNAQNRYSREGLLDAEE